MTERKKKKPEFLTCTESPPSPGDPIASPSTCPCGLSHCLISVEDRSLCAAYTYYSDDELQGSAESGSPVCRGSELRQA